MHYSIRLYWTVARSAHYSIRLYWTECQVGALLDTTILDRVSGQCTTRYDYTGQWTECQVGALLDTTILVDCQFSVLLDTTILDSVRSVHYSIRLYWTECQVGALLDKTILDRVLGQCTTRYDYTGQSVRSVHYSILLYWTECQVGALLDTTILDRVSGQCTTRYDYTGQIDRAIHHWIHDYTEQSARSEQCQIYCIHDYIGQIDRSVQQWIDDYTGQSFRSVNHWIHGYWTECQVIAPLDTRPYWTEFQVSTPLDKRLLDRVSGQCATGYTTTGQLDRSVRHWTRVSISENGWGRPKEINRTFLANGWVDYFQIWCVTGDPLGKSFTQVRDGWICTCARALPFSLSRERLGGLWWNLVCG